MENLIDVRPFKDGHDLPAIVKACLGKAPEKPASGYGVGWKLEGIEFEWWGYSGTQIAMSFSDAHGHTVSQRVSIRAFHIDASLLKSKFEKLKKLLAPIAEIRAKEQAEFEAKKGREQELASLFEHPEYPVEVKEHEGRESGALYYIVSFGHRDSFHSHHFSLAQVRELAKAINSIEGGKSSEA